MFNHLWRFYRVPILSTRFFFLNLIHQNKRFVFFYRTFRRVWVFLIYLCRLEGLFFIALLIMYVLFRFFSANFLMNDVLGFPYCVLFKHVQFTPISIPRKVCSLLIFMCLSFYDLFCSRIASQSHCLTPNFKDFELVGIKKIKT